MKEEPAIAIYLNKVHRSKIRTLIIIIIMMTRKEPRQTNQIKNQTLIYKTPR